MGKGGGVGGRGKRSHNNDVVLFSHSHTLPAVLPIKTAAAARGLYHYVAPTATAVGWPHHGPNGNGGAAHHNSGCRHCGSSLCFMMPSILSSEL